MISKTLFFYVKGLKIKIIHPYSISEFNSNFSRGIVSNHKNMGCARQLFSEQDLS